MPRLDVETDEQRRERLGMSPHPLSPLPVRSPQHPSNFKKKLGWRTQPTASGKDTPLTPGNLFSTISSSGGGGDGEGEAPFLIPPSRPFAMPESDGKFAF